MADARPRKRKPARPSAAVVKLALEVQRTIQAQRSEDRGIFHVPLGQHYNTGLEFAAREVSRVILGGKR